ncbi:hypothetical protein RHGRI_033387 [Rhododendron griersonianum]|uniref:PB1 domain-containing protein n=1 Tax=Rhododendron griersonianum TaxID=479676 RepID=A0AAV6HWJ0_9ERIC|nr:hypothetical protein RHGRI_033387 [Rhododendron griersonianum]KAG5520793.1 hypothetical protein RHGRI_033387 [Rhododendron griersonianum]
MVGPSLNTHNLSLKPNAAAVKFLCSYGGKILPRYPDGMLRYHGGQTRVLAVDRSISFSELMVKLVEMCGTSVSLRCQLPSEDLDALVSITSNEDLANLVEEYDRAASPKIRAFLSPLRSVKKISPPPSTTITTTTASAVASPKSSSIYSIGSPSKISNQCVHQITKPIASPYRCDEPDLSISQDGSKKEGPEESGDYH